MTTLTINGKESALTFIDDDTDLDALLAPYMTSEETPEEVADRVVNRGSMEWETIDICGDAIVTERPVPCTAEEYRIAYRALHAYDCKRPSAERYTQFIDPAGSQILGILSWWEVDFPEDAEEIAAIRQSRQGSFCWSLAD